MSADMATGQGVLATVAPRPQAATVTSLLVSLNPIKLTRLFAADEVGSPEAKRIRLLKAFAESSSLLSISSRGSGPAA